MRHWSTIYHGEENLLPIRKLIGSHPPQQTLIQVFCGISDMEKVYLLRSRLRELFPGVGIIGASSVGEIVNAQVAKHSAVISVSLFDHTRVKTVLIEQNDDLIAAGRSMGAAFEKSVPEALIVFGCGIKNGNFVNNLPFLKALHNTMGDVVLAGGLAGGHEAEKSRIFVFSEQGFVEEGFVAAGLSGDKLCIYTAYNLGWVPIGKNMTVTHSEGNRLYTIDNIPACEIYNHYLGFDVDPSALYYLNHFPLMTEKNSVRTTNSISTIHPDGSFELIQKIQTGEQVRFSFCDVSLQEESANQLNQKLAEYDPEAVFVYTCVSRMEIFGEDIAIDMEALKCCHNAAGFFTFGEYFTDSSKHPFHFQQTMTVLALSERDSCQIRCHTKSPPPLKSSESDLRRLQILKVLSHLVSSTTHELETTNQELAEQANKDGLTGLANRRLFDETLLERISEHNRSKSPLSLIMMDVDFFKQFNDLYGHVAGDDCLRGIAQVLKRTAKRTSDMAFRYGGEEFGCILAFTDHEGAVKVAEAIRRGVEHLKIPHERSTVNEFVTVSIGVLTVVNPSYQLLPQKLISDCDLLLYQAKEGGRNRVVDQIVSPPSQ
nr:diguanylate cyclase [uncultured Desulfobulbus sp.]